MEFTVKEREYKSFKDIDGVLLVNDVYLCQKEDFEREFRKLCEKYNGKANMIESVSIFEHELTFFELQLIDALCRYGEYEYITNPI